jgi:hypothetical protein
MPVIALPSHRSVPSAVLALPPVHPQLLLLCAIASLIAHTPPVPLLSLMYHVCAAPAYHAMPMTHIAYHADPASADDATLPMDTAVMSRVACTCLCR